MSPTTPYDPLQDIDRRITVPTPGRRRSAAADEPSASVLPGDAPDALPLAIEAGFTGVASLPEIGSLAFNGGGLNPLVQAANPLLDLVMPLRTMPSHANVEALRDQLVTAVGRFERQVRAQNIPTETIAAARYALCTLLDETIASTPWGSSGVWNSRSLLVLFHNEAWGGEKFFIILQRLSQDAHVNVDILELMYVCLALGLEGRYRVLDNGRGQLDALRERLQALIHKERGQFEADLSPRWHGAGVQSKSRLFQVPVWVLAAIAATLLLILHLCFSVSLNQASDPVYAAMRRIQMAPPAPLPAHADVPVPGRMAKFLAPEIAQGLVSVAENADRTTVTLLGNGIFGSGRADVEFDFLPLLGRIGEALLPVPGKVIVIGHTDDTRVSLSTRFRSNFDLSRARAASVQRLLMERAGPPERYSVEGRGETEPLARNDTPANRTRNRRVDIVVLTPSVAP